MSNPTSDPAQSPDTQKGSEKDSEKSTAQQKLLRVLGAFQKLPGYSHTLAEIATAAGLDKQSTKRALKASCEEGTIERFAHGRYGPGGGSALLAMRFLASHTPPASEIHTALVELNASTGGIASFYAAVGDMRVCAHRVTGNNQLNLDWLEMLPVAASLRTCASGRVILAHMPPFIQGTVLAEPAFEGNAYGVLPQDELEASLKGIRERGFAIGREEGVEGWDTVAAPVMRSGVISGSVLVRLPADRHPRLFSRPVQDTITAARQLSLTRPL
ncbi:IclR family transcriptional regulator [Streptomyces sp. L500]